MENALARFAAALHREGIAPDDPITCEVAKRLSAELGISPKSLRNRRWELKTSPDAKKLRDLTLFAGCKTVRAVCRIVALELKLADSPEVRADVLALVERLGLKRPLDATLKTLLHPHEHSEERKATRREAMRRWYEENRSLQLERMAGYYAVEENRRRNSKANSRHKSETGYSRNRKARDPAYKLRMVTAGRICKALEAAVERPGKLGKTLDLLGCSAEEYRLYLEGLFEPGMSWENWGEWHVDHAVPVAAHDLSTEEGQRAAFHFSNTRPMWARENLSKGSEHAGRRWRFSDHSPAE